MNGTARAWASWCRPCWPAGRRRWASCSVVARRIWLNLELAKKPEVCLEYILVHELLHLIERRHNHRFRVLLDRHLPDWRQKRLPRAVAKSAWGLQD